MPVPNECKTRLREAESLDLQSYLGKWYEIASFPFFFQRGCANTTAEYSLDGSIVRVTNTCRIGLTVPEKVAVGSAKTSGKPNVLKVGFPPFEFLRADYIILFVDDTYSYVVIGSSFKRYLWILARDYRIDPEIFDCLVSIAKDAGYNTDRLVRTKHCYEACILE